MIKLPGKRPVDKPRRVGLINIESNTADEFCRIYLFEGAAGFPL